MCFWLSALTPCRTCSSSSFWPSRAGCGPARLRFAPRSRAAAAGILHGARPAPRRSATRAPWARLRSPAPSPRPPGRWPPPRLVASLFGTRGPARLPRIPSPRPTRRSTCARAGRAAATSADARRCSPQGGTCAPSRSLPLTSGGTWFPPGGRCALLGLRVDLRACAPVGPPLRSPTLGGVHLRGGRAPSLRHIPPYWGGRGGTWSALGKHRAGPALKGGEAGLGPVLSLSRMCSRCGTPIPIVIAPDGSNRCRRIKPLRRPTVPTLSLATVVAPTALSLIGCTILRAVSGILRTQRGRSGSGPRRLPAIASRPCGLSLRPFGSTLSHLVGVGSQPLAMGHGRSAWGARYRARSNQAPASLPSPSACSGRRDWAGGDCGWLPARRMFSPSPGRRRRSATCQWLWTYSRGCSRACQIKPGHIVAAAVIGVQRGGKPGLARSAGGNPGASCSWRVWCRGTGLRPCVFQLGCRRCGRSPASRGLAGLGVTGLSAARLRAGTTVDAILAVPAVTLSGPDRAREPRWAAPDQTHPPHPASGLLTSGRRRANGPTISRCHRTPRCGLGRGPRPDRATRRSRSVSPCQSRSRRLASARARSGQHGASRLAVPAPAR